jgi:hypothetical protein
MTVDGWILESFNGIHFLRKALNVAIFSVMNGHRSCLKAEGSTSWLLQGPSLSHFCCWPADAEIELHTAKYVPF